MLKKTITYEDYDGVSHTEDFYFNLTKAELIEVELKSGEGGYSAQLRKIVESNDGEEIIETFKKLILLAYGHKSEDGKRFIKSEQLREEFTQTPAYSALFVELATDAEAAATFMNGIVPAGLADEIDSMTQEDRIKLHNAQAEEQYRKAALERDKKEEVVELPPPEQIETSTEIEEKDPKDMTKEELLEAYRAKSQRS